MRIIPAARADELEHVGVAAFGAAVDDANRLAPDECRAAMAGLPGQRECHTDRRPHAQPRVTVIVQTWRWDRGQARTRTSSGHTVRIPGTAHSTPTLVIPALPTSGAACPLFQTIHTCAT